ncbi:F-box domain-containing protein [Mycena indigotica]|uniref:F-box domain-containing protein n=1 Tax=Mycena indigotica TaxID=2126181 RepID=A0A8H6S4K0_9AGAR|nr:F-box domain-containing protein [Mycena indigotica]KAF7292686.1 F-box domain-containing protein [Mycena indigotica]
MYAPTAFELPNELWTEVLADLPRSSLIHVRMVSRHFYALAHPVFFRSLILDPDHHASRGNRDFLGMLQLYTGPHIRKHVRDLSVSFRFARCTRSQRCSGKVMPLSGPMLAAIPTFSSLRTLECAFRPTETVDLSALGFHTLPMLDKLTITGGSIACPLQSDPASRLRVAHFAYTDIPGMEHVLQAQLAHHDGAGFRSFLSALDPAYLTALTLRPSYDVSPGAWLSLDAGVHPSFTRLATVDISVDGPFLGPVRSFLAALPALANVVLSGAFRSACDLSLDTPAWPQTPAPVAMTRVRRYTGPAEYLARLRLPNLTSITLTSAGCRCAIRGLFKRLDTTQVEELALMLPLGYIHEWVDLSFYEDEEESICWRNREETDGVFGLFPRLRSLRLRVTDNAEDDKDVLDAFDVLIDEIGADVPNALVSILREADTVKIPLDHVVVEWDVAGATVAALPEMEGLFDVLQGVSERMREIEFKGGVRDEDAYVAPA